MDISVRILLTIYVKRHSLRTARYRNSQKYVDVPAY